MFLPEVPAIGRVCLEAMGRWSASGRRNGGLGLRWRGGAIYHEARSVVVQRARASLSDGGLNPRCRRCSAGGYPSRRSRASGRRYLDYLNRKKYRTDNEEDMLEREHRQVWRGGVCRSGGRADARRSWETTREGRRN
ncbi:unnamed protein product [Arctia plantaginis]|uniref:Uncharacterized protein n=1 Tax=Arctia plantaginis TaxID=874455 RepID=A0A8S1B5N5_ARCPL|nr:unnamed protein product [Arctia plantaginis]